MILYICCAGGMTSSFFCKNICKEASVSTYMDSISPVLKNLDTIKNKAELIIMYGPATYFNENTMKKYNLKDDLIGIWVAPQVRHLTLSLKELMKDYQIPVETIDMKIYGTMNGKKAWEIIQTTFLNH